MKKLTSLILAIILIFSTTVCLAQNLEFDEIATKFTIPDNWKELPTDNEGYHYSHSEFGTINLTIGVFKTELKGESDIEKHKDEVKKLCESKYNNNYIQKRMYDDGIYHYYNIYTDSVIENIEYYNDVKYYRYEKAYTVSKTYGGSGTPFYFTSFITIKDGILYTIEYNSYYNYDRRMNDVFEIVKTARYGKSIDIYVNDKIVYPDSFPVIIYDRTIVPIRAIVEELGYNVLWDEEYRQVIIENDEIIIGICVDSNILERYNYITEEYEQIEMDVNAIIYNDRTYLPLRAVGEALNCEVLWDGPTRTININSK